MHKPESLHYGRCPKCRRLRLCVLLTPEHDLDKKRRYYIRAHSCGRRLVPLKGVVTPLRNDPELVEPSTFSAEHRERS